MYSYSLRIICYIRFRSYFFRLCSLHIIFVLLLFTSYHIRFASICFLSYSIRIKNFLICFEANVSESNPSICYSLKYIRFQICYIRFEAIMRGHPLPSCSLRRSYDGRDEHYFCALLNLKVGVVFCLEWQIKLK
jgi:hypothetical protein